MVSRGRSRAVGLAGALLVLSACADEGGASTPAELAQASPWPTLQVRCPPGASEATVADLERQALALWQRSTFDAGDGPRAVQQLAVAVACARGLGDLQAANRLSALRDRWKRDVERRLDRETLRLELSLRSDDASQVRVHARRVSALLRAGDTPEVRRSLAWLKRMDRRARVGLAANGKEEP